MRLFTSTLFFLASITSASAFAQTNSQYSEIGEYDQFTRAQFLALSESEKSIYMHVGQERGKDVYICASNNVPGKLIDGWCYVPWRGKEYKNTDFKVLLQDSEIWRIIPGAGGAIGNLGNFTIHGVTPGLDPHNNYTYHCVVEDNGSEYAGRYLANLNLCEISWRGKTYAHNHHYDFYVLGYLQ